MKEEKTLFDEIKGSGYFGDFIQVDKIEHYIKKLKEELKEEFELYRDHQLTHKDKVFLKKCKRIFKKHIGELE